MNTHNSISVCQVRSLEVGDHIAVEVAGGIMSGRIKAIPHTPYDLNDEQTAYMKRKNLYIPEGLNEPISRSGYYLLFWDFYNFPNEPQHIYLQSDVNVAVFLNASK